MNSNQGSNDVSKQDKPRHIKIINNAEKFSSAPAASVIISCGQHKSTTEKELRDLLFQMRTELLDKFGPDFEMLNSLSLLGADMRYTLEPSLDITNKRPLL